MLKQCIVCNTWFDARGTAKCCSPVCKRERYREWKRERRIDPEYRERERERKRERLRELRKDPEYRERKREWDREWLRKKRLDKKFKSLQTGIEQFLKENKGQTKNGKTGRN